MPWNKDCVSPVHIEAQELCCGQQQACLVVSKLVRDKVGDVPEWHTANSLSCMTHCQGQGASQVNATLAGFASFFGHCVNMHHGSWAK